MDTSFPVQHHMIHVNGIQMHYVTAGEGKPVVLLHGFPEFWYAWRRQIPALAQHFKVIVPDLRGYGDTDKPANVADYRTSIIAEDIADLIRTLGYEKADVVGHDWGGAVAWQLALDHPEVIDHLAVLNCPHPAAMAKALRSNFKQIGRSWYIFFFQIPYLSEFLFNLYGPTLIKTMMRGSSIRKEAFTDEDLDRYYKELQKPGALTAALNYYRATFRQLLQGKKTQEKKKKIDLPTLVIWGENDTALGKELTEGMQNYFNNTFDIKYVPNCSHWVNEEQPELVNQWLIEHLTRS
jgi:epoxide hydrolase 4